MALFQYKAADAAGDLVEGRMEALDQAAAIKRLQAEGQIPIRIEEASAHDREAKSSPARGLGWFVSRRVTRADVGVFTLELATLLHAGLALDRALELMLNLTEPGPLRDVIERVHAAVRRGSDLSAALEAQGPAFSRFYLNIVRAGEASGALELALNRLSEFLERARVLRETLTSAMLYPCILLAFSLVSIALILGVVIPRISQMFTDAGQELPLVTQLVVAGGQAVGAYWWLGPVVLAAVYWLFKSKAQDERWRTALDRRLLSLPLFGGLLAKYEAARFTRTLGTLLDNGVPLLDGIAISQQAVGNRVIALGLDQVATSVRAGKGLAQPLIALEVFPKLAGHLMHVGEQTGNLQDMLLKLADIYDEQVQNTLKRAVDILGPVLILVLGLFIAGIIMSVLAAILSVNELAF